MANLCGHSRPKMRESRPAYSAGRLPICQLGGDSYPSNRIALGVQHLTVRAGIPGALASILVPLIWEGRRDD